MKKRLEKRCHDCDDYRVQLGKIIDKEYATRRQFCEIAGIKESLLSQVLTRKKHLSTTLLVKILAYVGYRLKLLPKK